VAEIVNLRQARKAKARAGKQATAEHNRARFGRTRAEKEASRAEVERAARQLDQIKRDRDD
jgi:hypothetical protein